MNQAIYKFIPFAFSFLLFLISCTKDNENIAVRQINTTYTQFGGDTFDVDGNGVADLLVLLYYDSVGNYVEGDVMEMIGLNGATIASESKGFWIFSIPALILYKTVMPFNQRTVIDASYEYSDTLFIAFEGYAEGEYQIEDAWKSNTSFFGFTLERNGNTHYGWGIMQAQNMKTLRVSQLAYENRPNTPIKAGEE
jgi:hypothetical protein